MKYYEYKSNTVLVPDPFVGDVQRKLNALRPFYSYAWEELNVDGKYGKKTANVVRIYQGKTPLGPASGQLGPTTADFINSDWKFRTQISISSLPVPPKEKLKVSEIYSTLGKTNIKACQTFCDFISTMYNTYTAYEIRLNKLLEYVESNKKLGQRVLRSKVSEARCVLRQLRENGLTTMEDLNVYGRFNRENVLCYMRTIRESFLNRKVVVTTKDIMRSIKPLVDFLNRIPGLKFFGSIEKLLKGFNALIQLKCEEALGLFLDAIREILESILVDIVVSAAIGSGSVLFAIAFVLFLLIADYFWFSDNPGDSIVDKQSGRTTTRNYVTKGASALYKTIYK